MTSRIRLSHAFDVQAEPLEGTRTDVSQDIAATNPIGAT